MARKGFYEELLKAQELKDLSGHMVQHANKVMTGDDEARKDAMTHKILPKIIDKAIATQITGEDGGAIVITVAREGIEKYNLNESPSSTSTDTVGQAQV